MIAAVLVPVLAVALGAALGLGARRWGAAFEPIRSFALAAVTVTIALHLLPEAVAEAGPWALAVLAGGVALPTVLGAAARRLGRRGADHAGLAVELSFFGVLAHQLGDGLGLGVATSGAHAGHAHWELVAAIGAHTIPLAAVVAITAEARHGRAGALGRLLLVAVVPLLGMALASAGSGAPAAAPWLNAAVSGLLLHVLAHDLPSAGARSPALRTAELVAIVAGATLPLAVAGLGGHGHDHDAGHHAVTAALEALALAAAPALLAGIVAGAVVTVLAQRARVRWLGGGGLGGALRGAVLGVPLPPCSCDRVPMAEQLRARGAGPAQVLAFCLAAPEVGVATVLLTAALLGWPLAALRLAVALAIAIAAAALLERLAARRAAPGPGAHADDHDHDHDHDHAPRRPGAAAGLALPAVDGSLGGALDDRVAHEGSWIVVGLLGGAFVGLATGGGSLGGVAALGVVALALLLPLSATAGLPIVAALTAAGLPAGAALTAAVLGSMVGLDVLRLVRDAWGRGAAAATLAVAVAVAGLAGVAVEALGLAPSPPALPRALSVAALAALGLLAAASLWRHGLAHWLAALRGPDHGHDHGPGPHRHHGDPA